VRHFLDTSEFQIILVILRNVTEKGGLVDDVGVSGDRQSLGNFSGNKNGQIAFFQMSLVFVVLMVVPYSLREDRERGHGDGASNGGFGQKRSAAKSRTISRKR
jgi:hypothetical protein